MKTIKILMLEHDEDDQYLTSSHFREIFPAIEIDFVSNSDDFFFYLNQQLLLQLRLPSLFLLNHNSTPWGAAQILKTLKSNADLSHIPVVVLSGQRHDEWIRECYTLGASSFIQKPALFTETREKISNFIRYWFHTVELDQN